MSSFANYIHELQHCARMLISSTRTQFYYLDYIRTLRHMTNVHAVILDSDRCIVVL